MGMEFRHGWVAPVNVNVDFNLRAIIQKAFCTADTKYGSTLCDSAAQVKVNVKVNCATHTKN